ncbi:GGDEF domain-containing protein [Butyrivibrio sp. AE2032]|uniref:GGDEF domain-containing protein n=1 Tax=Butyrivibrio sp. AE2032 TaxID=1458463 RepID=UPI000558B01F|nr:GGDEF domain-containing protein [Butyrivibrio sp. AE2032]
MKLWNYQRLNRIIAAFILLSALAVVALFFSKNYLQPNFAIYDLNEGWDISLNGVKQSSTSLLDSNVGVIGAGDVITISRTIPDFGLDSPCVCTTSIHAMIDAYLDDTLIYSFGRDYLFAEKTVPKKTNYFPLGQDYAGKKLTIVLSGSRRDTFTGVSPVTVGERNDLLSSQIIKNRYNILAGMFLIILGQVLMVLSPYMIVYHNNDYRLFFSGLVSLLFGIYTYSFYGLIDFICDNPNVNTICEYSSLYNIPTAILGYLMSVYHGKLKKVFRLLFCGNIGVFLTVFFLCVMGKYRIFEFTVLLHGMAMSEAVFSTIVIVTDEFKKRKEKGHWVFTSGNVFSIGLISFMALSLVDIVRYNYAKYFGSGGEPASTIDGFVLGSIFLVSSLLISYILYIIYNSDLDSMQNKIASLAYTDPLTGLANRARCEQVMDMLSQEHIAYTIISLDLNKLKEVNDTLGHHEGDRLLQGFATILSDSFMDANLVGRMGGDEFLVIMTEERALNTTRRIHDLYSMINDWNRKEQMFQYSASYGYAYSYEVPTGSAQEVYMLADNRMYEMKKEHHNGRYKGVVKNA